MSYDETMRETLAAKLVTDYRRHEGSGTHVAIDCIDIYVQEDRHGRTSVGLNWPGMGTESVGHAGRFHAYLGVAIDIASRAQAILEGWTKCDSL